MRLYDLRVTVERIEGRSVCGLEVGDWFEVTEVRGLLHEGQVSQFQVKMKVGFRIMSEDELTGA